MFQKRDIVIVNFPLTDGSAFKLRPAIVLSSENVNKTGDTLILQITSKLKPDGLSIELPEIELLKPLPLKSYARVHKVFIIENKFIERKISEINAKLYSKITSNIYGLIK